MMFNDFSNLSDEELDKKLQTTYERINKVIRLSSSSNIVNPLLQFRDELILERSERSVKASAENPENVDGNKYNDGTILDTESDFDRKKADAENENNKKSRHEQWKEYQDNKKKLLNDKEAEEDKKNGLVE